MLAKPTVQRTLDRICQSIGKDNYKKMPREEVNKTRTIKRGLRKPHKTNRMAGIKTKLAILILNINGLISPNKKIWTK